MAIVNATGAPKLFDELKMRTAVEHGGQPPMSTVLGNAGDASRSLYLDLYRGMATDEKTGRTEHLGVMRQRECLFGCEVVEATMCGRKCINMCELAVLWPPWFDTSVSLEKMLGWANSALSRIRTPVEPYGYTVEYIGRGVWKWAVLPEVSREGVRITMMEEAKLMEAAQSAFSENDFPCAVARAIAALELFPESYRAHHLVTMCGLLHKVPIKPEELTRSARFVHDRDLVIQKAIPFFRAMILANPNDKAQPIVEAQVELFEAERVGDRMLLDAIRPFLGGSVSAGAANSSSDGDYSMAIALVSNAPPRSAGRVPEVKTVLDHPDLARLVHQITDRIGGDDLDTRKRVQRASRPVIAWLIRSFGRPPTMEQLVLEAEQKLEGLIMKRIARQRVDRDGGMPKFLPEDLEVGPDGVWRQRRNPRKRPRPKREDD